MENQEKILENLLYRQREAIKNYPVHAKEKVLQMMVDGYRVITCDNSGVRLIKGSSYYFIERTGIMHQI